MKTSLCITSYYKDIIYINRLIPYIKNQTLSPDEIILFCSGINKMPDFNYEDLMIEIYAVPQTLSPAQARNYCISKTSNDLIIFFDIDDFPHPQKVELTIKNIQNHDFLLHSYQINNVKFDYILQANALINLSIDKNSTNIICNNRPIHHAHIAVNKKVFDNIKYNENAEFFKKEDGKFCQDLIVNGYKGTFLDCPLVSYSL